MLAATLDDDNNNKNGPNMFEDEDCFDLCDDWELGPPSEADNEDDDKSTGASEKDNESTNSRMNAIDSADKIRMDNNKDIDAASAATASSRKQQQKQQETVEQHKPSFQRMRLEMQWELRNNQEDCDLEVIETCGDFCADCVGVGRVTCRFCQGKGKLYLPPTNLYNEERIQTCPVCNQGGMEECKTCRGSGRIAPWTSYSTS